MAEYSEAIREHYRGEMPRKVTFLVEMPTGWSIEKQCKHVGRLTDAGDDLWLLAQGFMAAISRDGKFSRLPKFEKRYGTAGIVIR